MNSYQSEPGSYTDTVTWDQFGITSLKNLFLGNVQGMSVNQRIEYLNKAKCGTLRAYEYKADGLEGPQNKISKSGAPYSSENNNMRKLDFKGNYNI